MNEYEFMECYKLSFEIAAITSNLFENKDEKMCYESFVCCLLALGNAVGMKDKDQLIVIKRIMHDYRLYTGNYNEFEGIPDECDA